MPFEAGPHYGTAENFISQIIYSIPSEEIDFNKVIKVSPLIGVPLYCQSQVVIFHIMVRCLIRLRLKNLQTLYMKKNRKIGMTNIETFKRYLGKFINSKRAKGSRIFLYTIYENGK